jgi:hypothetical protein
LNNTEEHYAQENTGPTKETATRERRKLHNAELHNYYSSNYYWDNGTEEGTKAT